MMQSRPRTWPLVAVASILLATAMLFAWACYFNPRVNYLAEHGPADWIVAPTPGALMLPTIPMDAEFRRNLTIPLAPTEAEATLRAFRRCTLKINGQTVPDDWPESRWKEGHAIAVGKFLRQGENEIVAVVTNTDGPPAFWFSLNGDNFNLISDASWEASLAGGPWQKAALASSPRPYGDMNPYHYRAFVLASCGKVWPWWLLFAALTAAAIILGRRCFFRSDEPESQELQQGDAATANRIFFRICFILTCSAWIALFLHNAAYLTDKHGFDVAEHLDYVRFIQKNHSLPLADQGLEMYHPPLYYASAAALLSSLHQTIDSAGISWIRLLNLALALGNIAAIGASLRLLFPGQTKLQIFGLLFGAFLPMNLYLFHYPTNEVLAATAASAAAYCVLRILCNPRVGVGSYLTAGLVLGVGMLSKITVSLLFLPALLAIAAQFWTRRGEQNRARSIACVAVLCVAAFAVCGWHYIRTWKHFGTPLASSAQGWWQTPGYRTAGEYSRFGQSLVEPSFAAWNGAWDGFFSTFWGNPNCGGGGPDRYSPWNYDLITAGYLLAVPMTLLLALGLFVMLRKFFVQPDAPTAFLLLTAFFTAAFMLFWTLKSPNFSSVKAFFGLMAAVPLCAFAAWGMDLIGSHSKWLRCAAYVLFGVWAMNAYASYWIRPNAPQTLAVEYAAAKAEGRNQAAADALQRIQVAIPTDASLRLTLAKTLFNGGDIPTAAKLLELPPGEKDSAARHVLLGEIRLREHRNDEALAEFQQAATLDPDNFDAAQWLARAVLSHREKNPTAAIDACQNLLRLNPYSANAHRQLVVLYRQIGNKTAAERHRTYYSRLQPKNQSQ